jgi:hypothetical protein
VVNIKIKKRGPPALTHTTQQPTPTPANPCTHSKRLAHPRVLIGCARVRGHGRPWGHVAEEMEGRPGLAVPEETDVDLLLSKPGEHGRIWLAICETGMGFREGVYHRKEEDERQVDIDVGEWERRAIRLLLGRRCVVWLLK